MSSTPTIWHRAHVLCTSQKLSTRNWALQSRLRSTGGSPRVRKHEAIATKEPIVEAFPGIIRRIGSRQINLVDDRVTGSRSKYVAKKKPVHDEKDTKYQIFGELLQEQFSAMLRGYSFESAAGSITIRAYGIKKPSELRARTSAFRGALRRAVARAARGDTSRETNFLYHRLQHTFVLGGLRPMNLELKTRFVSSLMNWSEGEFQSKLADFRYPAEWFPATRALQRTIHLHIGPTNSGKTYHALQRLEKAKTGIYAGPLRLLAHEIYTRMNAMGKPCALITGEERRIPENLKDYMSSCTVEMVSLNTEVEVAVIDEIQMMADPERGWAWTHAFLGVRAKELHLCGEVRTKKLIEDLCLLTGDKLVIHEYKRLGPLETEKSALNNDLSLLQKGDALILFSRIEIHAYKRRIERETGKRCAVVYGSLPPETRAAQAALFNDPDNDYDYLAASDAIGMGLNLSIKRIVFENTAKHDGTSTRRIYVPELKQIAGRAGRFKTASEAVANGPLDLTDGEPADVQPPLQMAPNVGYVTTLHENDLEYVEKCLATEPPPMKQCAIFPPEIVLARFASYFPPKTPFSYILLRLHDIAEVGQGSFFLASLKDQLLISDVIQESNLTTADRIVFTCSPANLKADSFVFLKECADCVGNLTSGHILELKGLDLEILGMDRKDYRGGDEAFLKIAETLHKNITLYLWLSYRFPGVFISQALAFHIKKMTEEKINECLDAVSTNYKRTKRQEMAREKAREGSKADNVLGYLTEADGATVVPPEQLQAGGHSATV